MEKVKVTFEYDEASKKWESFVTGVKSMQEARHAFNAVAITVMALNPRDLNFSLVIDDGDRYKIIPAV